MSCKKWALLADLMTVSSRTTDAIMPKDFVNTLRD